MGRSTAPLERVELHIDSTWIRDLMVLVQWNPSSGAVAAVSRLGSTIDLVIGQENITEFLPAEPVLPFIQRLAFGLETLRAGNATKTLIEFEEAPWELAIGVDGDADARISLYSLDTRCTVRTHEARVDMESLVGSVRATLTEMLHELDRLPTSEAVRHGLRALRDARQALNGAVRNASNVKPPSRHMRRTLCVETRSGDGMELSTTLDLHDQAILSYLGEHPADRHAMLAPGAIVIRAAHPPGLHLGVRPLVTWEAIVAHLYELVTDAVPDLPGEARPVFRDDDGATLVMERAGDLRVSMRWSGRTCDERSTSTEHAWAATFDGLDMLGLWMEHVDALVSRVLEVNPLLETNQRLTDLRVMAAETRRAMHRRSGWERPTPRISLPILSDPESSSRAEVAARPMFRLEDAPRLRQHRTWQQTLSDAGAPDVHLDGAGSCLVVSDGAAQRIALRSGVVAWERGLSPATQLVRALDLAIGVDGRALHALSWSTGETRWTAPWRAGGAICDARPFRCEQGGGRVTARVAVASTSGEVAALDIRGGALQWTTRVGQPGPWRVMRTERALVAASAAQELVALHPRSGNVLWRIQSAHEEIFALPYRDTILLVERSQSTGDAAVSAVNVASGALVGVPFDELYVHDVCTDSRGAVYLLASSQRGASILCLDACLQNALSVVPLPWKRVSAEAHVVTVGTSVAVVDGGAVIGIARQRSGAELQWSMSLSADHASPRWRAFHHADACDVLGLYGPDGVVLVAPSSGRVVSRLAPFWEHLIGAYIDANGDALLVESSARRHRLHGLQAAGILGVIDGGAGCDHG